MGLDVAGVILRMVVRQVVAEKVVGTEASSPRYMVVIPVALASIVSPTITC